MISHFLNPPNWFTSASIFCSTYALALLTSAPVLTTEILVRACVLVVFGGVFDLLDGRVARLTNRFTEFGVQLDSIADILGFGLAPAMIAWSWKLHEMGPVGLAITFWYVLAASFRLARFNVDTKHDGWPMRGHTQGLTSTMSGGILVTAVWVSNGYLAGQVHLSAPVFAGFVGLLGYLMVSSIPFRHFRNFRESPAARRTLAVALAASLTGAFVFDVSMMWGVGALLYLFGGLIDGLIVAVHYRRLGAALLLSDDEEDADDAIALED